MNPFRLHERWLPLLFILALALSPVGSWAWPLPDSGQTTSFTDIVGEDSDTLVNPRSYTVNGDGTVTDNVTLLLWQQQDDGQVRPWQEAKGYCQALNLGGFDDWWLPTVAELESIVDRGRVAPAVDSAAFPGTQAGGGYWSSTVHAEYPSVAWYLSFHLGSVFETYQSKSYYVRCVRGDAEHVAVTPLLPKDNGVATDVNSGLWWQRQVDGVKSWNAALLYCAELTLDGFDDWRLPAVNELVSLFGRDPEKLLAEGALALPYWSSTITEGDVGNAWYVFPGGKVHYHARESADNVRCVRGGTIVDLSDLPGVPPPQGGTTTSLATTSTTSTTGSVATTTNTAASTSTTVAVGTTTSTVATATTTSTSSPAATTTTQVGGETTLTLPVSSGWSLLSSTIGLQAAVAFADSGSFTSVWKWQGGSWAVYLPGEQVPGSYAAAKGFVALTTINPGEGFWVNASGATSLAIKGTPVYGELVLVKGWNLVGLKAGAAKAVATLLGGNAGSVASVWKWTGVTWAVYLPGNADHGQAYAADKGFEPLITIKPGEGFWVNASGAVTLP